MVQTTRVKISGNNKVYGSTSLRVATTVKNSTMFYYRKGRTWKYTEFSGREDVPIEEHFALDLTQEEIDEILSTPVEKQGLVARDLSDYYVSQATRNKMFKVLGKAAGYKKEVGFMLFHTEINKELQVKEFQEFQGVHATSTASSISTSPSDEFILSTRKEGYIPRAWGHCHGIYSYEDRHGKGSWKGRKEQYVDIATPSDADGKKNMFVEQIGHEYYSDGKAHPSILLSPKGYMVFTNIVWESGIHLPKIYDGYAKDYSSGKKVLFLDPPPTD